MSHSLGVSRSIIPLLAAKGIKSLHLGYNAQCITPSLPSVIRWQHPETDAEIMLMVSDTYGEEVRKSATVGSALGALTPSHPIHSAYISLQVALGSNDVHHLEHVVHEGFNEALVFLYTPDNRPPPTADDVERYWSAVQHQFPNAV
jgi:hypothetical protein